jgi:D-arabinose 1-dehydrogenase-like Zn-dependent alcohol dehydrogenase
MRCYCVLEHGRALERVDQAVPQLGGTQVLVKVRAAGVCHTDLHLWEGHYDMGGGKKLTLAERGIKPPLTLSHEIVGEVVSVGPDAPQANGLVGQVALVHPWIGCGQCAACKRDEENICAQPQALGVARPGGFADYVLVPHPRYLVDISGLEPSSAAPLACAGVTTYSALKKFGERIRTDPVVIIGAGGLGLMAIEVLKALGGAGAVVVDLNPANREAALLAGAMQAIDARASDVSQQIQRATGGGARAVLDLVGTTQTVGLAMAAAARGGHIVICGLMGGDLTLSLPVIPMRPLTLQGSYVGTLNELQELVALVKRTRMRAIPVKCRPLTEVNEALQDLRDGRVVGRTVLLP